MSEYRPNVAALVLNPDGKLLICERLKFKGAWQFPQGGVDEGEGFEEALKREVYEEIGVLPESYEILRSRGGYRYDYPEKVRKKKKRNCKGQEQTYYLCRLKEKGTKIDIDQKPAEFRDFKWIDPDQFEMKWLPDFKKEVYQRVMWDFFEISIKD